MRKLSIGIMGSMLGVKYQTQMRGCLNTWLKGTDVDYRFFVGKNRYEPFENDKIVHFDVEDNFASATDKQWQGLRWLHHNLPSQFYLFVGTDNYVHIDKILKLLENYNPKQAEVISGYTEKRMIWNGFVTFPFGGNGLILSEEAMNIIDPVMDKETMLWQNNCENEQLKYLQVACDVCLGYIINKYQIKLSYDIGLYPCSWVQYFKDCQYPFPVPDFDHSKIIICHYMEEMDMLLYERYQQEASFYQKLYHAYILSKDSKSDINKFIPILYIYALNCKNILQLGLKKYDVLWPLMKGLVDNRVLPILKNFSGRKIVSVELNEPSQILEIQKLAQILQVDHEFVSSQSLEYSPTEFYDMICIDTWHTYGQLKRELSKFSSLCKKFIIIHDIAIDGYNSEAVRLSQHESIEKQAKDNNMKLTEVCTGLLPAVIEFLEKNKDFEIDSAYTDHGGLIILKRK